MFQRKNSTFLVLLVSLFIQTMYCQDLESDDTRFNETGLAIPDYIQQCSPNDRCLGLCIAKTLNHLGTHLAEGIPEFQLSSIDPLPLPEFKVDQDIGIASFNARFSKVVCTGIKNYIVTSVQVDSSIGKVNIFLTIPSIRVDGHYDGNSRIILFPIDSRGDFWCQFEGISLAIEAVGKIEIREGVRYMVINEMEYYFDLDNVKVRVNDRSNFFVTDVLNGFFKDNLNHIIRDIKPTSSRPIRNDQFIMSTINKVLANIPLKAVILDT